VRHNYDFIIAVAAFNENGRLLDLLVKLTSKVFLSSLFLPCLFCPACPSQVA